MPIAARIRTEDMRGTARISFAMAGIIVPSALAFGAKSEKRLAAFAVSAFGFVAVLLVSFWLVLGLAD
jgi:hypothetical protein